MKLCMFLGFCVVLAALPVQGAVIFEEDFEAYDVGTYPDSGGWIMTYNGTGPSNQYVENLYPYSGLQSLRLQGQNGWSSTSDMIIDIPDYAILDVAFYIHEIPQGDATTPVCHIYMGDRDLGGWGTAFAGITLDAVGGVHANPGGQTIGTYQAQTYYIVSIVANFVENTYSIFLDGDELLTDQSTGQAVPADTIRLTAGFGSSPNALIRFDDVILWDMCVNNGDVNLDGSITADDAQTAFLITMGLFTPTTQEECGADCDGNGSVTAGDAQTIFYQILGLGNCMD